MDLVESGMCGGVLSGCQLQDRLMNGRGITLYLLVLAADKLLRDHLSKDRSTIFPSRIINHPITSSRVGCLEMADGDNRGRH